ncbi:hypothetical protein PSP31121_05574 [Pandoraea sputorum]|uniref:Uncharacterized protein n=1 Tax=Pandoraea sputorum TaxID=93222 RepID=A0A5E5BI92_9BURK|nr:hypothetical protein PSP31121_05574 [Pandoraea sputorum]
MRPRGADRQPAKLALGDDDGRASRAVIVAVQAGVAPVTSDEGGRWSAKSQMADAWAAAARTMSGGHAEAALIACQEGDELHAPRRELKHPLAFRDGVTTPMFVGDACHDRFVVGDDTQCWLRAAWAERGVIHRLAPPLTIGSPTPIKRRSSTRTAEG